MSCLKRRKNVRKSCLGWPGGPFLCIINSEWSPLVECYTKEIKKFLCESRFRFCFLSSLKLPPLRKTVWNEGEESVNECVVKGCGKSGWFQEQNTECPVWNQSHWPHQTCVRSTVSCFLFFSIFAATFFPSFSKSARIQSILFHSFLMKYVTRPRVRGKFEKN